MVSFVTGIVQQGGWLHADTSRIRLSLHLQSASVNFLLKKTQVAYPGGTGVPVVFQPLTVEVAPVHLGGASLSGLTRGSQAGTGASLGQQAGRGKNSSAISHEIRSGSGSNSIEGLGAGIHAGVNPRLMAGGMGQGGDSKAQEGPKSPGTRLPGAQAELAGAQAGLAGAQEGLAGAQAGLAGAQAVRTQRRLLVESAWEGSTRRRTQGQGRRGPGGQGEAGEGGLGGGESGGSNAGASRLGGEEREMEREGESGSGGMGGLRDSKGPVLQDEAVTVLSLGETQSPFLPRVPLPSLSAFSQGLVWSP